MQNKLSILVVEDNPDDFALLQLAFKKNGIQDLIYWVEDGLAAIEYLQGNGKFSDRTNYHRPRLIVLDLKMPRMGGLELLDWVKSHSDFQMLPVLVMSSASFPHEVTRAYKNGANAFFVKPSNFSDLRVLSRIIHDYWKQCVEPVVESEAPSLALALQEQGREELIRTAN